MIKQTPQQSIIFMYACVRQEVGYVVYPITFVWNVQQTVAVNMIFPLPSRQSRATWIDNHCEETKRSKVLKHSSVHIHTVRKLQRVYIVHVIQRSKRSWKLYQTIESKFGYSEKLHETVHAIYVDTTVKYDLFGTIKRTSTYFHTTLKQSSTKSGTGSFTLKIQPHMSKIYIIPGNTLLIYFRIQYPTVSVSWQHTNNFCTHYSGFIADLFS